MIKDETTNNYRMCFNNDAGRRVLGHLLIEAGFFDELKTLEDLAVENYAKKILKKSGIYELDNVESFVRKLFELPVVSKE